MVSASIGGILRSGRVVGHVRSLPVNCSWPQSAHMPHATCSIECLLCNCVCDSLNVPSLKLSANFCHVVSVNLRYTAAPTFPPLQLIQTSLAGLLTMSKAGLFSTKPNKLSLPELCYFTRYQESTLNKVAIFSLES